MLPTFPSRYWFTIGLPGVFSLAGWSPRIQTGLHVSRPTQAPPTAHDACPYGSVTLCGPTFQTVPVHVMNSCWRPYNPRSAETPRVWALPLSIATTQGIDNFFLFLRVLRCFSSPRSPRITCGDRPSACRVAPFGHLRINTCLLLPGDFRSLPRPSSPPEA